MTCPVKYVLMPLTSANSLPATVGLSACLKGLMGRLSCNLGETFACAPSSHHGAYTCVVAMQLVLNEQRLRVDNQILRAQQGLHPCQPAQQQGELDSNVRPQQRDL